MELFARFLFLPFFLSTQLLFICSSSDAYSPAFANKIVCPPNFTAVGERCFETLLSNMTFKEARLFCKKGNFHLADVISYEELDQLYSILPESQHKYFWLDAQVDKCSELSTSKTITFTWGNASNTFEVRSKVMFSYMDEPCCLTIHQTKVANKLWWMPCDSPKHVICTIHTNHLTSEHLTQTLANLVNKCRDPLDSLNMTRFEGNIRMLERVLDRISAIHSHTILIILISVALSWLVLLTVFSMYNYTRDRMESGEYSTEMKSQQNYYEGLTGPDEYASYSTSPSVMNSTEGS